MAAFVRRITIVPLSGSSDTRPETVFKKKRRKRKVSKWLRPMERTQRRMLRASKVFTSEALDRHNRSNRKRRNGWLRDSDLNRTRSLRKAFKELRD